MTNRRKFLERSALGAGSVLLLPALVGSCITDHDFPDPPMPIVYQDVAKDFDWNNAARKAVATGLGMIPEVGEILGALVDIFWPETKEDVWDEVKAQVEALIDLKIGDLVSQQVRDDLAGLSNSTILYLHALKNENIEDTKVQWIVTRNSFAVALPHFQSPEYQVPLLGMFAQFANIYLAILRDGAAFGKGWGMNDAEHKQVVTDLQSTIKDFRKYAIDTYWIGRRIANDKYTKYTQENPKTFERDCIYFAIINEYDREMTLTVLDYMNTWEYFDVSKYPNGTKVELTREIYSDPMGTCVDEKGIKLNTHQPPTNLPTNVTVWAHDRINAVQVTYPAGGGPGGVTKTERMGSASGSNKPPLGGTFNISPDNPITKIWVSWGDVVEALIFEFSDGTKTPRLGKLSGDKHHYWSYELEGLSSIHINGRSRFYDNAEAIVLGFKFWQSPSETLDTVRSLYVNSPNERPAAEYAKVFPNNAIPAVLITEELKSARKAHWESVNKRAKALK